MRGVYYTPPEVALLAERTLAAWRPAEGRRAAGARFGLRRRCVAESHRSRTGSARQASRPTRGTRSGSAVLLPLNRRPAGFDPHLRAENGLLSDYLQPGRFDLIVGNPPYISIRQAGKDLSSADRAMLANRFRFARGHYDLYLLFLQPVLELLAPGGALGFIVPDKFGSAAYALACRQRLLNETTLLEVHDLGEEKVFRRAAVYPWLLVLRKELPDASHAVQFTRSQGNGPAVSVLRLQRQLVPEAFSFSGTLNVDAVSHGDTRDSQYAGLWRDRLPRESPGGSDSRTRRCARCNCNASFHRKWLYRPVCH